MPYFPAFLDLTGKTAVVVGSGPLLAQRAGLAARAGAAVTVITPDPVPELAGDQITVRHAAFADGDVAGAALVLCVAADDALAGAVSRAAMARAIPVNIADRPELSTFVMPAVVERGDMVIGISSGGTSPLLARRIRARLEALLPARLPDLARFAASFRDAVKAKITGADDRRRFWERVLDGPVADLVLAGDDTRARETMLGILNRAQPEPEGVVHLVGAGPGDPELLTLAAFRALQQADVVLYDALVGPDILAHARREADLVPVGRRKGDHRHSQDDTNRRMVAEARAGRRVVRLKGGDPYVYGRGGEERDFCRARGVKVVVVPGITAALGCAAQAGIPLTHRDAASALTVLTGHKRLDCDAPGGEAPHETVVVYMANSNAEDVAARLAARGFGDATPVAIIENGTRPDARVSTGFLADLPVLAARHAGGGPALLVVGEVVRYADAWAEPAANDRVGTRNTTWQ